MNKINYFFGKVYSFFMTAVWVLLFAIGTLIAFLFYVVLRLFQLKKIADDVMWGSGRFWCKAITYMLGAKVSVIGKEKNSITGLTITFRHPNIIVSTIKEAREPI